MKTERPELTIFSHWEGHPDYAGRIRRAFEEHLQTNGLRLTGQRRRILDYLLAADRHVSLKEIHRSLHKHGVGRVTVFRTLKMLEQARLVDHVTTAGGTSRFEMKLARPHHDHLICVDCGSIVEVSWPRLEKLQEKICREMGFRVAWHRHEVFGRCRACEAKAKRS